MTDKIEAWKRRKAQQYNSKLWSHIEEKKRDERCKSCVNATCDSFLAGLSEGERLGVIRGRAELLREIESKMTPRVSYGKGFFMGFAESEEKKLSALLAEGAGEEK